MNAILRSYRFTTVREAYFELKENPGIIQSIPNLGGTGLKVFLNFIETEYPEEIIEIYNTLTKGGI